MPPPPFYSTFCLFMLKSNPTALPLKSKLKIEPKSPQNIQKPREEKASPNPLDGSSAALLQLFIGN